MSKKKSYMDTSNILNEGTLGQLFKSFFDKINKLKQKAKNRKVKKHMDGMNAHVDALEKIMSKLYGHDITLSRYTEKDFEYSQRNEK